MRNAQYPNSKPSGSKRWVNALGLMAVCSFLLLSFCADAQKDYITTIAGNGSLGYSGDMGPAIESVLFEPVALAFNDAGELFIADYRNFIVRKIDVNGYIATVAGRPTFAGDSLNAIFADSAAMGSPTALAVNTNGDLYIADYDDQVVRKVDAITGMMTIVAGIGVAGYNGDSLMATQAEINYPNGLAFDGQGNLYIADNGNNVIRKVDNNGRISTYAGNSNGTAGYSGDGGPATAALLYSPSGLFADGPGNLYIADEGNSVIRKVAAATGIITTVAGNAYLGAGYSGDDGPATAGQLNNPTSVAIDLAGNLYIAEYGNEVIRKVDVWGDLSTVAGCDTLIGFSGDNGPATAAVLDGPYGVAFDRSGNLYIADKFNSRVRKITQESGLGVQQVSATTTAITLAPNPNSGIFTVKGTLNSLADQAVSLDVVDMLGRVVFSTQCISQNGSFNKQVDPGTLANGLYLLHVHTLTKSENVPFIIDR